MTTFAQILLGVWIAAFLYPGFTRSKIDRRFKSGYRHNWQPDKRLLFGSYALLVAPLLLVLIDAPLQSSKTTDAGASPAPAVQSREPVNSQAKAAPQKNDLAKEHLTPALGAGQQSLSSADWLKLKDLHPYQLISDSPVTEDIKRRLGAEGFEDVLHGMNVTQGDEFVDGQFMVTTACMKSACSIYEGFLAYDIEKDTLFAAVYSDNRIRVVSGEASALHPAIARRYRDWGNRF